MQRSTTLTTLLPDNGRHSVPPRHDGQSRRLRRHDPDGRRRHQTVLFCSITAFVCLCCHVCEEYSSRDTRLAFLSTVYYSTRFTASPNIVSQLLSSSHTALHTRTNIQTNRQTDHQPIQRYISVSRPSRSF